MKKVTVLFSIIAVLLLAGATMIQQNDTEKKAIMAALAEESSAWYSSDFDRWATAFVNNPDYMGINISKSGYVITDGWEDLSANSPVRTKRLLINQEKVPLRIKVYDNVAWVVFNNFNINNEGKRTLNQVVTAILEKEAGKWKMTYRSAINPATYSQADTYLLLLINSGKASGKTIDEIATTSGNLLKAGWNQAMGPQGLISAAVTNWRNICLPENFKILERDVDHAVFTVDQVFPNLKSAGQAFGVTYDEYLTFLNVQGGVIADHMGVVYKQEMTPEGIKVSVSKK